MAIEKSHASMSGIDRQERQQRYIADITPIGVPPELAQRAVDELRFSYEDLEPEHREPVMAIAIEIRKLQKRTREYIFVMGKMLLEAKARISYGHFANWLGVEFELSVSTAQRMMQVATVFPGSTADAARVRHLPDRAIYMLAANSTPVEARERVIELIDAGAVPTSAVVQTIIAEYRPERPARTKRLPPPSPEPELEEEEELEPERPIQFRHHLAAVKLLLRDIAAEYPQVDLKVNAARKAINDLISSLPEGA